MGIPCASAMTGENAAQSISDEGLTERNKAVVRAYLGEIAQHGAIVACDRYFTTNVTFNGDPDLARQLARVAEMRGAFPDLEITIEQQIAEGPWVATRVYRGTRAGEFAGVPATGRRIEYAGTAMDRLENGKVAEMWHTVKHASSDAADCRRWKPATETMINPRPDPEAPALMRFFSLFTVVGFALTGCTADQMLSEPLQPLPPGTPRAVCSAYNPIQYAQTCGFYFGGHSHRSH
jgi:predicted ester cyclase